jgi:hypothetical protein
MITQGHKPWLNDWFTVLHTLLNEVDRLKQEALDIDGDEYLSACITASWNKVERYYKLTDKTPVYYAAIVLNPTLKVQKLREMWCTEETELWVSEVEEKVKAMWRTLYKPPPRAYVIQRYDDDDESAFSRFSSAKRLRLDAPSEPVDALEAYLSIDPELYNKDDTGENFDVIGWWLQRQHTYPGLAQFALDVFSVPLMSDDNERSFSSGRDMITYRRTCLQSDIMEACQCLRSWLLPTVKRQGPLFDEESDIQKDMDTSEVIDVTNSATDNDIDQQ